MNSRCDSCGIPVDELANLKLELKATQGQLSKTLAQLSKATGERNAAAKITAFADEAWRWFNHWNETCREGNCREFNGKRWDNCIERLTAGQTFEEKWEPACEGARRLLTGELSHNLRSVKTFTEMATMLKDEAMLSSFVEMGQRELKPSNVVQLRPAPDHSGIPTLSVWVEGRILGDCPHCGQAGRVVPKRDGLGLFECFGKCAEGSGVYRLAGHEVAALRERTA